MHLSKQQKKLLLLLLKRRGPNPDKLRLDSMRFRGGLSLPQGRLIDFLQASYNEVRNRKSVYPSVSRSLRTLQQNGLLRRRFGEWSLTEKGVEEARRIRREIMSQIAEFELFL